ncbi:MAG TPA: NPCBM/NEW2 domain-containing protein, partial [Candidatus Acidoferrum sp.]|nr:NPCBM/NEW2 domain-containing protein [Candidatus Acidoferrum sp.]
MTHKACLVGMLLLMAQSVSAENVWLDDLNLAAATQGWGQPRKNLSVDGHALTVGGKTFQRGFGTHAESILSVNLNGG